MKLFLRMFGRSVLFPIMALATVFLPNFYLFVFSVYSLQYRFSFLFSVSSKSVTCMNFDLNALMLMFTLQLWSTVRNAYGDQPDLSELAETLSKKFESLYEKEV